MSYSIWDKHCDEFITSLVEKLDIAQEIKKIIKMYCVTSASGWDEGIYDVYANSDKIYHVICNENKNTYIKIFNTFEEVEEFIKTKNIKRKEFI